ncbi:response regulator transcription factor [Lyngbya sp. PCC 8106]|uniref:response regulator transcription factor n=1 Tax=Lyngbya sp. (strain PCC 8106) TaxID=313612 RepID=UPI0000EACA04|nr:response regulator [Lyngbya sp. PCC 8106]EAW37938.1 Response regulator receiver domain protein (CheY) [Lyngbya sp. PCC 8106]
MTSILVIEDNSTEANLMIGCLRQSGFDVHNVSTAEAAKVLLEHKIFDAIVTDVVLPGQSGFGLCRQLKNQNTTAHIPIIICSSKSAKIDKNWGLKQGASAYVTKPIDREELIDTVRRVTLPSGQAGLA